MENKAFLKAFIFSEFLKVNQTLSDDMAAERAVKEFMTNLQQGYNEKKYNYYFCIELLTGEPKITGDEIHKQLMIYDTAEKIRQQQKSRDVYFVEFMRKHNQDLGRFENAVKRYCYRILEKHEEFCEYQEIFQQEFDNLDSDFSEILTNFKSLTNGKILDKTIYDNIYIFMFMAYNKGFTNGQSSPHRIKSGNYGKE